MSTKNTKSALGMVVYVLVVIVVIAVVGLVFQLTNGFKTDVKTFYVTVDKTIITDSAGGYVVNESKPLKGVVRNLSTNSESKGYTLKVVPNKVDGKDFAFTADGKTHAFQAEENLTSGFEIAVDGNAFSLVPKGRGVANVLKKIYGDTVSDCNDKTYKDMFTLLVTSKDGKNEIKLNFSVSGKVTGVELSEISIVF